MQKYGVENPQQNREIIEKTKETCFKRFGYNVPVKVPEIKQKIKNTCLERYGVDNYVKTKEYKVKTHNTLLKRYNKDSLYSSKAEKLLYDFIKLNYNGIIIQDDRDTLRGKELDIYLPDIGIAFDGDGDRIMVVDKYNRIYEGDFLTYVFATNLHQQKLLIGNTVVYTEVVNPGIVDRLKDMGIEVVITEVGDHHISKALEREYVIGGESSGHIINKTILPFGDGLNNALELIKVLTNNPKKLHEYSFEIKFYYSKTINIYLKNNDFEISKKLREKVERYASKHKFHLVLRKSGTEKAIRIFIYKKVNKGINKNINKIVKMIENDK